MSEPKVFTWTIGEFIVKNLWWYFCQGLCPKFITRLLLILGFNMI